MPTMTFPGAWRFSAPPGCAPIPQAALWEFFEFAKKVATQGESWRLIERFKSYFSAAAGSSSSWSSNESWAETDLQSCMSAAAQNPPLFLEAFWLACVSAADEFGVAVPTADHVNEVCQRHGVEFRLKPPAIERVESVAHLVSMEAVPPTLSEVEAAAWQTSRQRAEELLSEGRPREAIQEMLWILESLSTAFRGVQTPDGTVRGKYFNTIVKELRTMNRGTTLERVAEWSEALHGFLSSPTGGGVRHGLDLKSGAPITPAEGRLMCNLISSYIGFLLSEHERLFRGGNGV